MQVIANTSDGFLIQANENELKQIISAVNGTSPEKISIGQKIPAIDYAATITKIKALKDDYSYKELVKQFGNVSEHIDRLKEVVNNAANIQI